MTEQPITRNDLRDELRHYATKADLASMEAKLVKWLTGIAIAAVAAAASVTALVLNLSG